MYYFIMKRAVFIINLIERYCFGHKNLYLNVILTYKYNKSYTIISVVVYFECTIIGFRCQSFYFRFCLTAQRHRLLR